METPQILNELKTRLAERSAARDAILAEITKLEGAIEAMEGKPKGDSKPVADLIYAAGLALSAPFDNKSLKTKAIAQNPDEAKRIKTGVYSAVATLLRNKRFERTPGGLKLGGS